MNVRALDDWSVERIGKTVLLGAIAYGVYYVATHGVKQAAVAATGVVTDAAAGVVIGAGKAVGIPETDESECAKALREGRTWDASFACPAGMFLKHVVGLSGIDREIERQAREQQQLSPWIIPVGAGVLGLMLMAKGRRS